MRMTRLRLLLLLFLTLALTGVPGVALADNAGTVAGALHDRPVYQAPGLDLVDVGAVQDTLSGSQPKVYVAVLPANAASSKSQAQSRANDIGRALGESSAVVLVVTKSQHLGAAEGSNARSHGVDASTALSQTLSADGAGAFDKATITRFVQDFTGRVRAQATSSGSNSSGSNSSGSNSSSSGGGHTGVALLVGLLVLLGLGGLLAVRSSKRRKGKQQEGMRADVESLYNRLGSDVSTLDARDDRVAQQALSDASERYGATGAALSGADTPEKFAAARRTAVEGLVAARTARKQLGLDPGPEIPLPPGTGPQLQDAGQVQFNNQSYSGAPSYQPGYQHYYGGGMLGGQMVPGGWYSQPFWTPFLLGSALSGGFGGGGMFGGGYGGYGGYGGGYGSGYEEGREDAREDDQGDNGGGGGDWGGGGGDWGGGGGGGGGGDWGGGGGGGGGDGGGGGW
jgi:hypothetical protein